MKTGTMLKLLFVEDDPSTVEEVLELVRREQDLVPEVCGFEEAQESILESLPDIVVIDLLAAIDEPEGLKTRDFVWKTQFCPIVVYSARPDLHEDDEEYGSHPFVKSVQKGRGSPKKVLHALREFRPHVDALKKTKRHIIQSFSLAMRDVAPDAFKVHTNANRRKETILRAGRRRLAALMDNFPDGDAVLVSWEQYLCPPVSSDPETGDVLCCAVGCNDAPDSFRIVLTPSCDMVAADGRAAKTESVLVAKCCSMRSGLERTSLKGMLAATGRDKQRKLRDRLKTTLLSRGSLDGLVPVPALPGRIPTMMANLRNLQLIPIENIGKPGEAKEFIRVASIDSPFREALSWAYLQVSGRPGLPERDLDSWSREILESLQEGADQEAQ